MYLYGITLLCFSSAELMAKVLLGGGDWRVFEDSRAASSATIRLPPSAGSNRKPQNVIRRGGGDGGSGNKFADLFAQHMAPTEESKIQIERKYLGRH